MNYFMEQHGPNIIYLRRISPHLGIGREYCPNNKIIYEGYYKFHSHKGWVRITL